jgi:hypothetical protein
MRKRRKNWILRRLALGLAVAAVAAPAAQARVDEGAQSQKSTFVPWATDFGRSVSPGTGVALPNGSVQPVRPDDRAVRGVPATSERVAVRPDDRAVRGVPATSERLPVRADDKVLNLEPTVRAEYNQFTYRRALPSDYGVQPVQIASKADGFDWNDAGIGAGLAFGLMLLLAGATLGTRHISRPASI